MKRKERIVYYSDEKNDDFFSGHVDAETVGADFRFVRRGPLWLASEFVVYRIVATPVVFLISKAFYGLRIRNRKALKALRGTGYFLYGNHTQDMMDAYTPSLVAFPKRAHIVTGPEAVSIAGVRRIVQMLGAIPIPGSVKGLVPFRGAVRYRVSQKRAVAVYPEAHIWPWFTGVRDFDDSSFEYPVECGVPCVAFVTTFRKRRIFKNLHPFLTVTVSDPFYPDPTLPKKEARRDLRDRVRAFMKETVSSPDNYEYVRYIKRSTRA